MDIDVREFLKRFSADVLENRGILIPDSQYTYLLRAPSVRPLINLMKESNVERLVCERRRWFLAADGTFANPGSRGDPRQGMVEELRNPGNAFMGQNRHINPFFPIEQSS